MITSKEQEANIMAYFSAKNKAEEIKALNESQALKLNATNSLIDFSKGLNFRLANEYSNEVKRIYGIENIKAQDDIGKAISDASMSLRRSQLVRIDESRTSTRGASPHAPGEHEGQANAGGGKHGAILAVLTEHVV